MSTATNTTPAHNAADKIRVSCSEAGKHYRQHTSDIIKRLKEVERQAAEASVRCTATASLYAYAADNLPPPKSSDSVISKQKQADVNSGRTSEDTELSVAAMMDALGENPSDQRNKSITSTTARPRNTSHQNGKTEESVEDGTFTTDFERRPTMHFEDFTPRVRRPNENNTSIILQQQSPSSIWQSSEDCYNPQSLPKLLQSTAAASQRDHSLLNRASQLVRTIRHGATSVPTGAAGVVSEEPPLEIGSGEEVTPPPSSPDRRDTSIFQDEPSSSTRDEKEGGNIEDEENSPNHQALPEVHPDLAETRRLISAAKEKYQMYTSYLPPKNEEALALNTSAKTMMINRQESQQQPRSVRIAKSSETAINVGAFSLSGPQLLEEQKKLVNTENNLDEAAKNSLQTSQINDLYFSGGQKFAHLKRCAEISSSVTFSPPRHHIGKSSSPTRKSHSPPIDGDFSLDSDLEEMMEAVSQSGTEKKLFVDETGTTITAVDKPFFRGLSIPSTRKGISSAMGETPPPLSDGGAPRNSKETISHKLDRLRPPNLLDSNLSRKTPDATTQLAVDHKRRPAAERNSLEEEENERKLLQEIENERLQKASDQEQAQRDAIVSARETAAIQSNLELRLIAPYLDDNGFIFSDPLASDQSKSNQLSIQSVALPLQVPSVEYPLTMTWPQAASHPDKVLLLDSGVHQQATHSTLLHHWKSRRIAIVGKRLYVFRHPSTRKELQMEIEEQVAQEAADRQGSAGYHRQVSAANSPRAAASVSHAPSSPFAKLFNRSVLSVGVDCLQGEIAGGSYLGKKHVVIFRYTAPPHKQYSPSGVQLPLENNNHHASSFYNSAAATSSILASASKVSSRETSDSKTIVFSFATSSHLKETIGVVYGVSLRSRALQELATQHLRQNLGNLSGESNMTETLNERSKKTQRKRGVSFAGNLQKNEDGTK